MHRNHKRGLRVAIVGATGMVGRELIALLENRRFPVSEILPFSSGRNHVKVRFRGRSVPAHKVDTAALQTCDIVFLVSSEEVAMAHGPQLAARGIWVIDDSTAFRMNPKVPLVIPEVNADALKSTSRLIAGPNCTMTGLGVAGSILHRAIGVREVRLASYQSVSGAGKAALVELFSQIRELSHNGHDLDKRAPVFGEQVARELPRQIAFNVIPQVGRFDESGSSSEEIKVCAELRKIWSAPRLRVSTTAVRVPTIRGHALAAWLTLARPISVEHAHDLFAKTPGLKIASTDEYPTPRAAGGKDPVFAGRIRQGATPREIALWIVSDNLLKGAALNSVQIAETLLRRGWLQRSL